MAQAESSRWKLLCIVYLFALLVTTVNGQPPQETNFVKYHKSPKVRVISKLAYAKYGAGQLYLGLYLPVGGEFLKITPQ